MNSPDRQGSEAGSPPLSKARPLEGVSVGISVSLGENSARKGFSEEEMNRAVVRLSEVLLAAGARLVFGHDWRPTGVMSAVARLAVNFDGNSAGTPASARMPPCRITNLVPWDRSPELPEDLRLDLEQRRILKIEAIPVEDSPRLFDTVETPPMGRVSGSVFTGFGLMVLRRRLAELCDARVCLGGKFRTHQGFIPGIVEESLLSAKKETGNRVLLSGLLGGAAKQVIDASHSGEWMDLIRFSNGESVEGLEPAFRDTLLETYRTDAANCLNKASLVERSGLSGEDWERLTNAKDIEVVCALAVKALQRVG